MQGIIPKKVLFVCIHNSARSQMGEAFLNHYAGDRFAAESAGLEAGKLNPLVVKAMAEAGIDISHKATNLVGDYLKEGRQYDFVITVCDGASGERCPVFPGICKRLHIEFRDPSTLTGSDEEKVVEIRKIRDEIEQSVKQFIKENSE